MNNNSGNFKKKKWRDFKQAREWAHTLGLMTDKDWREYRKKGLPVDIPSNPDRDYNHEPEWVDMRDFLKKCSAFISEGQPKMRHSVMNFGRHSQTLPHRNRLRYL